MKKKAMLILCSLLIVSEAMAATWYEVRGRTVEEAKANAKEQYGDKLVGEGKCRWDKEDGWVYCKVLINE